MAAVDLASQFHNLDGITIGERRKNLFKLIRNNALKENVSQLDETIKNLQPKTYLESVFKLEILIYFKKSDELLQILKEGNEIFISKIIKQDWFFKQTFKNLEPKEMVNEFLPSMSFAMRMKILRKLMNALTEDEMDPIFDEILDRYGWSIAVNILPSCSATKIEKNLRNKEVRLLPRQLKIIYDKNPQLLDIYLEEFMKNTGSRYDNEAIYNYVALKDPQHFLTLKEKYKFGIHLGRRITKKIVELKKNDVISNPKKYTSFLRKDALVRKLQADFKKFYANLFPNNIEDLSNHTCQKFLECYTKKYRYNLFTETFISVFQSSIWDNVSKLDTCVIDLMPYAEEREKWAELKYAENKDINIVKYYSPKKAIPFIKEKINLTSAISDRKRLLKLLLENCLVNKDMNAFEEVLKYFCARHRNEEQNTRSQFLALILDSFKPEKFNEVQWKYVNEIITIHKIKNEYIIGQSTFSSAYIEFLYKKGEPIDEQLLSYMKESSFTQYTGQNWTIAVEDPELERLFYIKSIELMPSIVKENIPAFDVQLMGDIVRFNKRKPEHFINIFDYPRMTQSLKTVFKKDHFPYFYNFEDTMKTFICKNNRNNIENEYLECYFNNLKNTHGHAKILDWFIKYEPNIFVKNYDSLEGAIKTDPPLFRHFKNFSHINLDAKVIQYCQEKIKDPENDLKHNCILALSQSLSTQDYIKLAETYIPTTEKVNLEDEEAKRKYDVQCIVVKYLKCVRSPEIIPVLLKFCIGDYLGSALPALYSIFYTTPEKQLYSVVDELSKRAVSVRKHALFLACNVFDQRKVLDLLKASGANEANASIQKHLFTSTLKYFLRNPSDEFWKLVKTYLRFVDKSDEESLKKLVEIKLPKQYKTLFVQAIWELLEEHEKKGENMANMKSILLENIGRDTIENLPSSFCVKIIKENFLQLDMKLCDFDGLAHFVRNYLLYHKEQPQNFAVVFGIIKTFKEKYWNCGDEVMKYRRRIYNFFTSFYDTFKIAKNKEANIFELFYQHWTLLFTPIEAFNEFVSLKLMAIKIKTIEPLIQNYAAQVTQLIEEVTNEYGLHILDTLVRLTDNLLYDLKEHEEYSFFQSLLKFKLSTLNAVFVLHLMPSRVPTDNDTKQVYTEILATISTLENSQVQLQLMCFKRKE